MANTWKDITVNSYGWTAMLRVNQDGVPIDAGDYTASFVFTTPSGTETTKSGSYATDGHDGIFKYDIAQGDISERGNWSVVATVTASGLSITTKPFQFFVGPNR